MAELGFDNQIAAPLRRVRRRLIWLRAGAGVATALLLIVLLVAVHVLLDWWLRLRMDMRVALLAVMAVTCGWVMWRYLLRPLRLRFGLREMAVAIEARHPRLNAVLVSAVDFAEGRVGLPEANSPELVRAVIDEAVRSAPGVPFNSLIDHRKAWRVLARVAGVLAVAGGAFAATSPTLAIWADRNLLMRDVPWPQRNRLVVEAPEDRVIREAYGDDLEIRAHVAEGFAAPRQVDIVFDTDSGARGRETMTGVGERGYRVTFPRVREAFAFHLVGGDDVTETYRVELSERPVIESATLTVTPPAYTELAEETLAEGLRVAEMYRGSRLTIRATASKDLATADLFAGNLRVAPLDPQTRLLEAVVAPAESRTYHFALVDRDGLENVRPARFSARILEDRAPRVRLVAPNVGSLVTLRAVLPLELGFSDELGVAEATLVYEHSGEGGSAVNVPIEGFAPGMREFETGIKWAVADAGANIGDAVTLQARGEDANDVTGPGVGESTTISMRIASDDELRADFQRREQEYRRQFERLVESQERLRRRLLTELAKVTDDTDVTELAIVLAPLERQQRQVRAQVNAVQQQFVQVLAEMTINRLDDADTHARLQERVIGPLGELGSREMSEAADQLRRLSREGTTALARAVDPVQEAVCGKMRQVLDNMLQWEGFQETVTMLREIMQLQRELNAETKSTQESRGSAFFED